MWSGKVIAAAVAMAVSAAVAGCGTSVGTLAIPTPASPPPTAAAVAPLPDTSGVTPPTVAGVATTVPVVMGPGGATIMGTVLGPGGPVAGATVEADRIVGDAVATTEASTAADGSFRIPGVLGGVFRLRAWQAPTLALTSPQITFVPDTGTQEVSLTLTSYAGLSVTAAMAPQSVDVGDYADVVVAVSSQVVGANGVVAPTPAAGQLVDVSDGGGWVPVGNDPATTGTDGTAAIELQCSQAGATPLLATVAGAEPANVDTTTCDAPPAETTSTVPSASSTTSTTTGGGFP